LIEKANKLTGDIIGKARNRVLSNDELNMLNKGIKCSNFNSFVRLAYYTGARSGEIRSLRRENIKNDHIVVNGKTGPRMVKLNSQAKKIIKEQNELWNYSKDFVSHKFKKECRKLGIKDARFHDLRRTFGYNLVRQGMSIFKVSKLLGHSSVRTTEKHYAPLLTTDIEEFVL
jgi:integrase